MTPKKLPRWLTPGQLIPLGGIAAAMFVTVMLNVFAARHFRRWDWTRGQRYTLSPATIETLHDLPDPVEIWVLMGSSEPLLLSVKQILVAYAGETTKLDVHYVDPDKDAIQLLDIRRRFKIEAARAEDGRVVTDTSIVVAHGDRHWFIGTQDLVEITESDDRRAKPREEQALTYAIRNVLSGSKARLCFTVGHDEMSTKDPGPQGVGLLKDLLEKDNYEITDTDPKDPSTAEPFKDCRVVVIAGPHSGFAPDEEARLRTYVLTGGSLLAAISPIGAVSDTGLAPAGLSSVLAPFGISLDEDVVIERDRSRVIPDQLGAFTVSAFPHAVTTSLVKKKDDAHEPPRVLLLRPRSIRATHSADATLPQDLLGTSREAFGVTSVRGASSWPFEGPDKTPSDVPGPLVVAMAGERPKLSPSAAHGPRAVVIGTGSVLQPLNWAEPSADRGAAYFVESAISWLAARPILLDIPDRPAALGAIRISDDARSGIWRYVLLYVPGSAALLGLAVALRPPEHRRARVEGAQGRPGDPRVKLPKHFGSFVVMAAAVAAGAYWFVDKDKVSDTERRDREHDVFPAYRRADVDGIELAQGDVTIKLVKQPDPGDAGESHWQLTSPVTEKADPAAVDRFIGDLEFAGAVRKVDAANAPEVAHGFDAPRVKGTLSMKQLVYHFALGGPAPVPAGASYFRVDGEGTYVISKDFTTSLLNTADAYRERTIVPYLSLDLRALEVHSPEGGFTVTRKDDVSFTLAGHGYRASRETLDRVWGAFAEARAESFLSDAAADEAIGSTPVHVVMKPKDPTKPDGDLKLGGVCPGHPEAIVLTRLAPVRESACVPKGALPGLLLTEDALVDHRLFAARSDEVEEIRFETVPPGFTVELARKGKGWHERKPVDRELEGTEIDVTNDLVAKLTRGEATSVGEETAEAFVPRARVSVKRANASADEVVELGATNELVRRAFDHALLHVPSTLGRRLVPSEIALRGRSVFDAPGAATPSQILTDCDAVKQVAAHEPSGWTLTIPKGFAADTLAIADLTTLVRNAQVDSWVADRDDGTFGFESSHCRLEVDTPKEGGVRALGIVFGKETEGGYFAKSPTDGAVFVAPRALRDGATGWLIDRSGFRVTTANVEQVTLARGATKVVLKGPHGKGQDDASTREAVTKVLATLEVLRPDGVVHLGPAKPDEGFQSPALDVRVAVAGVGGTQTVHFVLGDTARVNGERIVYARVDGVDATFAIAHDRVIPLVEAL